MKILGKIFRSVVYSLLGFIVGATGLYIYLLTDRPDLQSWHVVELESEFTMDKLNDTTSFQDYLALEDKLFAELDEKIYHNNSEAPAHTLNRYHKGSLADPTSYPVNWNRSFEMPFDNPRGGVLLLHGLSDSPYSLRALALALHQQGYYVLGLRMPGHGTAPSGLLDVTWRDMAAVVKLAARRVSDKTGKQIPLHIVGYSMGAAQAVNYTQDALLDPSLPLPNSLVLLSPAIGVSSVAALAVWQSRLATIPGLEKLAWASIRPEYDPYKYNSFPIHAGDQMYRLTLEIESKFDLLDESGQLDRFPRTLAFLSLADATVSTHAVVTNLLDRLHNPGNELVLFDLNRSQILAPFIQHDPAAAYRELLQRSRLDFGLTLLTNTSPQSRNISLHRLVRGEHLPEVVETDLRWPDDVYSLSHVALPFPPSDNLYGAQPNDEQGLHIGLLDTRGEKGVLNVPASDMLRLRYNPFYSLMQQRVADFLKEPVHE